MAANGPTNDNNNVHLDLESKHSPTQQENSSNVEGLDMQEIRRLKTLSTMLGPSAGDLAPEPHKRFRKLANPAPLGLCGFAQTTFVLSLINCHARSVMNPNIVIGLAFFYGGLIQLLTGLFEIVNGNTFAATALSSYGGFWMSFAAIYIPWFNIAGGYTDDAEFAQAVGLYLIGWFVFTFGVMLCTIRSTVAFFLLFGTVDMTYLMLAIGYWRGEDANFIRAGGAFGMCAALLAWYNAFAGVADKSNSFMTVPMFELPWSAVVRQKKRSR